MLSYYPRLFLSAAVATKKVVYQPSDCQLQFLSPESTSEYRQYILKFKKFSLENVTRPVTYAQRATSLSEQHYE